MKLIFGMVLLAFLLEDGTPESHIISFVFVRERGHDDRRKPEARGSGLLPSELCALFQQKRLKDSNTDKPADPKRLVAFSFSNVQLRRHCRRNWIAHHRSTARRSVRCEPRRGAAATHPRPFPVGDLALV